MHPLRIRHRNADRKMGEGVRIVSRAVKGVHDPTEWPFWPRLTLLFALDGVGGKVRLNPLANQGFRSMISIGYWVKFILQGHDNLASETPPQFSAGIVRQGNSQAENALPIDFRGRHIYSRSTTQQAAYTSAHGAGRCKGPMAMRGTRVAMLVTIS